MDIEKHKIQLTLDEMNEMFRHAIEPRNRMEYYKYIKASDVNYFLQFSADEIESNKVPASVAGCTGIVKLFCKLARGYKLDCSVVCMARYDSWKNSKNGISGVISGHQVISVNIDGKDYVFDPVHSKLAFIDCDLKPGSFCDVMDKGNLNYMVTAVIPRDKIESINCYGRLHNLYASGNINNPNFTIKPRLFNRAIKRIYGTHQIKQLYLCDKNRTDFC